MGKKARLKREAKALSNEMIVMDYLRRKGLNLLDLPKETTEETCPFKEICHANPIFGKVLHSNLGYEEMIANIAAFIKAWEM